MCSFCPEDHHAIAHHRRNPQEYKDVDSVTSGGCNGKNNNGAAMTVPLTVSRM